MLKLGMNAMMQYARLQGTCQSYISKIVQFWEGALFALPQIIQNIPIE